MNKLNVAVLYGGYSSEHEVSKLSAATIISNMSEEKYNIIPVFITREGNWLLYDGSIDNVKNIRWDKFGTPAIISPDRSHGGILRIVGGKVKNIPVDIVFPVLHGLGGEDGSVQGLLELSGIPYVGCGIMSSAICMDKTFTKQVVDQLGIYQTDYFTFKVNPDEELDDEIFKKIRYEIKYPCFIKPANSGSTIGISKCKNKKEVIEAVRLAAEHDRKIIVERAVVGRELETAVLSVGQDEVVVSGVGEIVSAADFYDYEAKYHNAESKTLIPADIDEDKRNEIRDIAHRIFSVLDCSGLARVDFFLEAKTNRVVFNEINTMPGFTHISMYPMLWNAEGLSTQELVDRLIEAGLNRSGTNG